MTKKIAFQGMAGAYSEIACRENYSDYEPIPSPNFAQAFSSVAEGKVDLAMIPIENSVAGRVADVHYLLPESGLFIIGEYYQKIEHHLLALPGTHLQDVRSAYSHEQALSQCRKYLQSNHIKPVVRGDTAGAAMEVAGLGDKSIAAIGSKLAGDLYGLVSLEQDIADSMDNVTRFIALSKTPMMPKLDDGLAVTTLVYRVKSIPSALYKSLEGFAGAGLNITKIESYLVDGHFSRAQFRLDVEGHVESQGFQQALAHLKTVADSIRILGTYPAAKARQAG